MASLTHQTAMSRATAAIRLAVGLAESTGKIMRRKKDAAPIQRPTVFAIPGCRFPLFIDLPPSVVESDPGRVPRVNGVPVLARQHLS
jgi:hypothetical protein